MTMAYTGLVLLIHLWLIFLETHTDDEDDDDVQLEANLQLKLHGKPYKVVTPILIKIETGPLTCSVFLKCHVMPTSTLLV